MSTGTDIVLLILLLGAAQGFLLTLAVLTTRRGRRPSNHYLALTLAVYSAGILIHALGHDTTPAAKHDGAFHHAYIVITLFYLIGPSVFLYTRSLTLNQKRHRTQDLVHGIPFSLAAGVVIGVSWIGTGSAVFFELVLGGGVIAQTLIYSVAVFQRLFRHSRFIQANFSDLKKRTLGWLRVFFGAYLVMWILALSMEAQGAHDRSWDYAWVLVSVFMYAMGYLGLRQPEILAGDLEEPAAKKDKKYERSTLTEEQAEACLSKLEIIMKEQRPHLEPDITLPALASRMAVSTHHLSQVINERLNQNFFEMINRHRVQEIKKQILDPKLQHLNVAGIGFQCGFNSLSSFNAAFKRFTGMTPSQFKRAHS